MKLHLPKMLLTVVLAACSVSYAVDQWATPQFGGAVYTWTGNGDDDNYATETNWSGGVPNHPSGGNGPVLVFDGVSVNVSGGDGVDTADSGGIKVIGDSVVSCTLGRWGGAIYVEEGSELTTSLGNQLKNTDDPTAANVYVGGKLTLTNANLSINDGKAWQNWQIDTTGHIDITAAGSVTKPSEGWHVQYLATSVTDGVLNRTYEVGTFTQKIIDSTINLQQNLNSVTVIDKATRMKMDDSAYSLTYGENGAGLTVSFTGAKYDNASLWTSGDITWKHGAAGWKVVGGDDTDTSFLNGDHVTFAGNGSAALQGNILVKDVVVGNGVDYTVNMAADSSLTIMSQKNNFLGIKLTGDKTTSLHLTMSDNWRADGDSRIILSEGSSVGAVYINGVFAYNLNNNSSSTELPSSRSNLGGADLHLAGNGMLVLKNQKSGETYNIGDANIGDIYFDGANGEIRAYGGVTAPEKALIADNIYASNTALKKTDGGTVALGGTVNAKSLQVRDGILNISGTTTIAEGELRLADDGDATIKVDGGELVAKNSVVRIGGKQGSFEVASGEATVNGLNFWAGEHEVYGDLHGRIVLGSADGDGKARINIGSEGIKDTAHRGNADAMTLLFGNGVVGATANWTTTINSNYTPEAFQFVGKGTGTIFDTADANDKTTARTITIVNPLAGSGKIVKDGVGTLKMTGSVTDFTGAVEVRKGLMELSTTNLAVSNLEVKADAELKLGDNGVVVVGSPAAVASTTGSSQGATLEGGATVTASLNLSNASILTLNGVDGESLVSIVGDLMLPSTGAMLLAGDVLTGISSLSQNGIAMLNLFELKGGLFVGGNEITEELTADNGISLSTLFTIGNGSLNLDDYYLGFTPANGSSTVYIGVVPEPTTATLSLLALAGLAARRRRR
ncbi:MAG: PEP-CTERM sorting domain-containing protein [Akkermansia sp.]|nr:PEP-CTERM sorting domain-containing protein [Akkermansia sp.]